MHKSLIYMVLLCPTVSIAKEFKYFNDSIDYWSIPKESGNNKSKIEAVQKEKTFDWKKYQSPSNPEFFKEGNYIPPEPFMEIVRDPSDDNIKNWFQYIELKNKLATRLQKRLKDYTLRNTLKLDALEKESILRASKSLKTVPTHTKRYRFRLFVDSKCPHCKKMLKTAKSLQTDGYYIEIKQIDSDYAALSGLPILVEPASSAEIKRHKINSVPMLLVGDLKEKTIFKINGYRSRIEVLNLLKR